MFFSKKLKIKHFQWGLFANSIVVWVENHISRSVYMNAMYVFLKKNADCVFFSKKLKIKHFQWGLFANCIADCVEIRTPKWVYINANYVLFAKNANLQK